MNAVVSQRVASEYIPMVQWGKDHWSTLAYIETVMVECAGFQIGRDPRMKSNRRHFRVMAEQCPNPKRVAGRMGSIAMPMQPEHATKLKDGQVVPGHDDWMCVQDMAHEGLFTVAAQDVEPGEVLHFSEQGMRLAAALRAHKANGGQFAAFVPV